MSILGENKGGVGAPCVPCGTSCTSTPDHLRRVIINIRPAVLNKTNILSNIETWAAGAGQVNRGSRWDRGAPCGSGAVGG